MSDSTLLHKGWYAWIGQKVCVKQVDIGLLKYFGEIKSRNGFWCGVEFDEPIGKTDGVIDNVRYFKCKANHGIFVPMHEVKRIKSRSIELRRLSDLSKFKSGEACFADKKPQTKLDTTFDASVNKNIQNNSGDGNSETENKNTDFVDDKRHVNVCKRSKNSYSRFGTEESLGILSNLLDEDDSWNLLDQSNAANEKSLIQKKSDEIENDSVFSPPVKTSLYSTNKPHIHGKLNDNPIQSYFNIKCTSTPKQCLNNIFDLGATVKLDHDEFDSLHEEIEPIIAGSSGPKSMDYDLTKFKHNEILCSTSKLTIPLLPNELPLFEEVPCMKEEFDEFDRNKKDMLNVKDGNCLLSTAPKDLDECFNINRFSNAQRIPESLAILNATYEVDEIFKNPTVHAEDLNQHLECESNAFYSDKKSNGVIDLNSTFVLYNDSPVKESQADKTFVIDESPLKVIEHTLPTESEINFEKKSLSIIFEKASNENLSIIGDAELVDVHSPNISSQNPGGNRTLTSSNNSSKSIDKLGNSLNSSMKITDKEPIASNLNSTFYISSDDSKKSAAKEVNKRHSLSAVYGKNNLPVQKEVSNIAKRKSIKQPQSFNIQKTVFKVPDSHVASTSSVKSNIIKKSTVSTFVNKKVEVESKTLSKDSSLKSISKLSSKDNLKTKCSSSIANVTEQFKKSLDSCKTLHKKTNQEESATHVALKITEKNTKITSRRNSIGSLETKVISKISYTNKISIAEHSNVNCKLNNGTDSHGLNSKNPAETKHNSIKRRHTMLPTILSNGVQVRRGLAKSKSDLSNNTSTAVKSRNTFKDTESRTRQDGFGNKKENSRESIMKKPAPVERILESSSKDLTKLGNKQIGNPTIPKRELLKPGMLSRLPVPGKSLKKPGFISNSVEPQQSIKNINQVGYPCR